MAKEQPKALAGDDIWFREQRQIPSDPLLLELDLAGKSVLDVGCGTGKDLMHPLFANTAERCGIDPDEEMIRYGREHYPGIKLSVGSAEALPYADAQFDLVLSRVALHNTDLPVSLGESIRVLKGGGSFLMTTHDLTYQLKEWGQSALRFEWKRLAQIPYVFVASVLSGLGCHVPAQPWNGRRRTFHSRLLLQRPLKAAGFCYVTFERTAQQFIVRAFKTPIRPQ